MKNKLLNRIILIWGGIIFILFYFLVFPFYLLFIFQIRWHKYTYKINRFWASTAFYPSLINIKILAHSNIKKEQTYIYCANHTSYLDIPLIGTTAKHFMSFMGKQELQQVPFFGIMFKRVHITVKRGSVTSAYKAIKESKKRIALGQSICIFPEGGIKGAGIWLNPFKDGAFKLAIETGTPIVPVSIPYNWVLLGTDFKLQYQSQLEIIYHEPIKTKGLSLNQIDDLKKETYEVIAKQLENYFPEIKQPEYR